MENEIKDSNILCLCQCSSSEHQIIFSIFDDFDDPEVFASIHLVPEYHWWKRVWNAIKYIFGYRCKYGHFEEFIFRPEDWRKLDKVVKFLKKNEEKRKKD